MIMSLQQSPIHSYNLFSPSKNSNLEPCCLYLRGFARLNSSFVSSNIHLNDYKISINKSCGSRNSRTMATINSDIFAPPAQEDTGNFYELLGISESGTLSEIKKAYKQLARKYHPDVSPAERTEEYTQRFILVQEAYETLSDPQTRALYDRDLSKGFHFAFSARKGAASHQGSEEMGEWKNRWESQLAELKRKRMYNEYYNTADDATQSWGSRMRSQNRES